MHRLYRDMSAFPQDAPGLTEALRDTRARTLGLMQAWCEALPNLRVPCEPTLNLPLWEWGHVGWFQTWWIGRNRQRAMGLRCEPDHERLPPAQAGADELFNSSTVPHASRWALDLPDLAATRAELARGLEETLGLLREAAHRGEDLYFWQLVLVHEDMHNEAALYMAQALGLPMPAQWAGGNGRVRAGGMPRAPLRLHAQTVVMGGEADDTRFRFDNELRAHEVSLEGFEIDSRPVSWGEYLEFVQATGYAWPSCVRLEGGMRRTRRFDAWQALDVDAPACYLSAADAQAWCDWAGRALPTEAQWECAARTRADFEWGQVWEWTASTFEPYAGFEAHPYRDYSAPWFGTHRVLRGASEFTSERLVSPCYRNFFLPQRSDVPAGFRTVKRLP